MGGIREGKGYWEVVGWVTEREGEIAEGEWEGELGEEGSGGGGSRAVAVAAQGRWGRWLKGGSGARAVAAIVSRDRGKGWRRVRQGHVVVRRRRRRSVSFLDLP